MQLEGIGLDESERIVRLHLNIHADHIESGAAVPNTSPSSAAE
jgi:hypothetical protein